MFALKFVWASVVRVSSSPSKTDRKMDGCVITRGMLRHLGSSGHGSKNRPRGIHAGISMQGYLYMDINAWIPTHGYPCIRVHYIVQYIVQFCWAFCSEPRSHHCVVNHRESSVVGERVIIVCEPTSFLLRRPKEPLWRTKEPSLWVLHSLLYSLSAGP